MPDIIIFIIGFVLGAFIVWFFYRNHLQQMQANSEKAYQQALQEHQAQSEKMMGSMREVFGSLSNQALSQNTEDFLKLAELLLSKKLAAGEQSLLGKKELIDQTLQVMHKELGGLQQSIGAFEHDRAQKYGQLAQQLKQTAEQTSKLRDTTDTLKNLLSNTKVRGQWGERMAEDLLQLLGMKEGVNYLKQQSGAKQQRPDFTFILPKGAYIHMDVKFPLNNYLRYSEAQETVEKQKYLNEFLRDVRLRVKEIRTREYIDTANHTLDYVLIFIPNESIYSFVMEQDTQLLDEALKQKVILCSPLTLYAILSIIRQATENFNIVSQASDIRKQVIAFKEQWKRYVQSMERLGKKIEDTQKEYVQLSSTRARQLDRSIQRIEDNESVEQNPTLEKLSEEE